MVQHGAQFRFNHIRNSVGIYLYATVRIRPTIYRYNYGQHADRRMNDTLHLLHADSVSLSKRQSGDEISRVPNALDRAGVHAQCTVAEKRRRRRPEMQARSRNERECQAVHSQGRARVRARERGVIARTSCRDRAFSDTQRSRLESPCIRTYTPFPTLPIHMSVG